jgi:hypothetical protein
MSLNPSEDASNPGGLGRAVVKSSSSPQDEYYRYKLLEAKLANTDGGADILNAKSEQDEVEIQILKKLVKVRESTPEWNQVVDLTGSRNRYEQARILAEIAYEKQKAEKILGFYVPNSSQLSAIFTATDDAARGLRSGGGASLPGVNPVAPTANLGGAVGIPVTR